MRFDLVSSSIFYFFYLVRWVVGGGELIWCSFAGVTLGASSNDVLTIPVRYNLVACCSCSFNHTFKVIAGWVETCGSVHS